MNNLLFWDNYLFILCVWFWYCLPYRTGAISYFLQYAIFLKADNLYSLHYILQLYILKILRLNYINLFDNGVPVILLVLILILVYLYTFVLFDVHWRSGSIVEIIPVGRETLTKQETQSVRWDCYQSKLFYVYPLICIIFFICNFY